MATLGKIRSHGTLLIIIIGFAMLAFIIGDFLSNSSHIANANSDVVGYIDGEKIHHQEYENTQSCLTEFFKLNQGAREYAAGRIASPLDYQLSDEDYNNIRQQAWANMVSERQLKKQAEKIGLAVTDEEFSEVCFAYMANMPYFSVLQATPEALMQYHSQAIAPLSINDILRSEDPVAKMWIAAEQQIKLYLLQQKYATLVGNLINPNSLDAEFAFNSELTTTTVEYVTKPYYLVADEEVEVSDSEIKALYKEKKDLYKQEPNRTIAYVRIPVVPSQDDYVAAEEALKALQEEFYTTEDVAGLVNMNSDITYKPVDLSADQVPAEYKEFCFGKDAKAGNVTEITFSNETYAMARLVEAGYSMPDSIKIQTIIPDSLLNGQPAPEAQWISNEVAYQLDRRFAEQAFKAQKGDRLSIRQGMQDIEVEVVELSAPTPKVKLAILARTVSASDATRRALYNNAMQYIIDNNTAELFEANAREAGYTLSRARLFRANEAVDNIRSSRNVVKWAFAAKVGEVINEVSECDNNNLMLIAALLDANDEKVASLAAKTPELRQEILKNKKAELIAASVADATTLDAAAQAFQAEVQLAENVSLASYEFGHEGFEPAAISAALNLNAGELKVVKGAKGVYVIKGAEKTVAEAEFNKDAQLQALTYMYFNPQYLSNSALNLLMEEIDVTDDRIKF